MTGDRLQLTIGGLLHDIGKVLYRQGDDRARHSQLGYEFLKNEIKIDHEELLNCVKYHHGDELKRAGLAENSMAYIVYIADNIASAADRRAGESSDGGFELYTPLQPVFNILNGNQGAYFYSPGYLNMEEEINYPTKQKTYYTKAQYKEIVRNLSDNLKGLEWKAEYLDSLLEVLEANLSFIPSSTSKNELPDISLFDHLKLTAAVAACIQEYSEENGIQNYREAFYLNAGKFYEKEAFLLASLDMSGIQSFIYTISTKKVIRTLRARSFYLEIMMEHMIDQLLERLGLPRTNLIYSGGGHCYLLLPNTEGCREAFDRFLQETNQWFLETFQTALYIAGAYAPCSSQSLKNEPRGSYSAIFRQLSLRMSKEKSSRYKAEQIIWLNRRRQEDYSRECSVCKRIGRVNNNQVCPICEAVEKLSQKILYQDFFTVIKEKQRELPLPGGFSLEADSLDSLKRRMEEDGEFVRAYGKNRFYTGRHISRKLWVGSYTNGKTLEELAEEARGINRIGILRADVDNLGQAFVAGFQNEANGNRYVTLSRTAALSRQLSLFFKLYLNRILERGEYSMDGYLGEARKRNITIVYSGGDDLFLVGAWNEIIEAAVDIRRKFDQYTEGTLTLSAGIGIYHDSYPIRAIASEVAAMEDASKRMPGKNSVTLLEDGRVHRVMEQGMEQIVRDGSYTWKAFEDGVIGDKLRVIRDFFDNSSDRGSSFLYRLLGLIRNQTDRINFARYVYLLSRIEPDRSEKPQVQEAYQRFFERMLQWIHSEKDRIELKTAITMYAYLTRENMGE